MDEMILAIDVGGTNLKTALFDINESKPALLSTGTLPVISFNDTMGTLLEQYIKKSFESYGYKRLSIVVSTSVTGLREHSLRNSFNLFNRMFDTCLMNIGEDHILLLSRNGTFVTFSKAISMIQENKWNIYNLLDTYWLPPSIILGEIKGVETYLYVDMGSSSTSMIPVVKSKAMVSPRENRIETNKLIPIGSKYTNVVYITNKININNKQIYLYSYAGCSVGNILRVLRMTQDSEEKYKKSLLNVAKLMCLDSEFMDEKNIVELAKYIYGILVETLQNGVTNLAENYSEEILKTIFITGYGKDIVADSISTSKISKNVYVVSPQNDPNTCTAVSLGLFYINKYINTNSIAEDGKNYLDITKL